MSTEPLEPTPQDNLDRLFGSYIKRQMPSPWPACQATAAEPSEQYRKRTGGSGLLRSRLTLAASVAALLGLGLYVTQGNTHQPPTAKVPGTGLLNGATADGNKLLNRAQPEKNER